MTIDLLDEAATLDFAGLFFQQIRTGMVIGLHGNLGAGKTTFVRGCLRASGYGGAVKSPTYTLVEEYRLDSMTLFHFDLYRLRDPEELEWMGIRDYFRDDSTCFIEWAERGGHMLPIPDLRLTLVPSGNSRTLKLAAESDRGLCVLAALDALKG